MGRRGHLSGPTALFGSVVWAGRTCERAYPCTSRTLHGAVPKKSRIPYKPIFATSRPLLIEISSEIVCPCQEYHVWTIGNRIFDWAIWCIRTQNRSLCFYLYSYYISPKHPKLFAPVKKNISERLEMGFRDWARGCICTTGSTILGWRMGRGTRPEIASNNPPYSTWTSFLPGFWGPTPRGFRAKNNANLEVVSKKIQLTCPISR